MTAPLDLPAIRARLDACEGHTPGPWACAKDDPTNPMSWFVYADNENAPVVADMLDQVTALLLAAAPTLAADTRALLAEVEALREAFEPVALWYGAENEDGPPRVFPEMLRDAVADLQEDRETSIRVSKALRTLIGILEIASVMPETVGKTWVPDIDGPELSAARAALTGGDDG